MSRGLRRTVKQCSVSHILLMVIGAAVLMYAFNSFFLTAPLQVQNQAFGDVHQNGHVALTTVAMNSQHSVKAVTSLPARHVAMPTTPEPKCGVQCTVGTYSYDVISGHKTNEGPTICFDGNIVVDPNDNSTFGRGVNVVVISDKTKAVIDRQTFDTYEQTGKLLRYLKLVVFDGYIVLMASMDEMVASLSKDEKEWLKKYGSGRIDQLKFRDSWVMVGQRGLTSGKAKEMITAKQEGSPFPGRASIQGCLSVPLGEITKIDVERDQVAMGAQLKGSRVENCGMKDACPLDHFAVHVYSGMPNKIGPSICVDSNYVVSDSVNKGGRGFNIVLYSPMEKAVLKTGRFDTYAIDSSGLEIFLETVKEGEIVVVVTHDDASMNLHPLGRKIMTDLGSSLVSKLGIRESLFFIGQKGIRGSTTLEQVELVAGNGWPKPIDKTFCVPNKLKGQSIKADPMNSHNEKRQSFCKQHDGFRDFCDAQHITDPLVAGQLTDKYLLKGHEVFRTPLIVVGGMNANNLRMTLETVLMQPGIQKNKVYVTFDEKFSSVAALIDLFEFNAVKLTSSASYPELMEKSLEVVTEKLKSEVFKYLIVVEEDLLLSPDFLSFMAYTMDGIDKDPTVVGVSAWNPNGFVEVSGNVSQVYRVSNKPGLGFMVKTAFYKAGMAGKMKQCCDTRAWEDWDLPDELEFVVPDVSRVLRKQPHISSGQSELSSLFLSKRNTNLDAGAMIDATGIIKASYEAEIQALVAHSRPLHVKSIAECTRGGGIGFYVSNTHRKVYSVYFEQSADRDYTLLNKLCKCFGLFYAPNFKPKNIYHNLVRFVYRSNTILLIGSKSPYFPSSTPQLYVIPKSLVRQRHMSIKT